MQQILSYLNLSISLTALLTFLESLSWDGIIDDIDLTRDTTMESKEQIRFKLRAGRVEALSLIDKVLPRNPRTNINGIILRVSFPLRLYLSLNLYAKPIS